VNANIRKSTGTTGTKAPDKAGALLAGAGSSARSACSIISMRGTLQLAVIAELEELLQLARQGEVMGLVYAAVSGDDELTAGAAGSLGRDNLRAAGALYRALDLCNHS
jgi:hypothetical protein